MKKIALIALVLVLALSSLGVAYARWADYVTIKGQVDTGSVKLGIHNEAVSDPETPPTPDVVCIGNNVEKKNIGWGSSVDGTVEKCAGYYESVTETIHSAYPGYSITFTNLIKNCGTVPVKITTPEYTLVSGFDLSCWMQLTYTITYGSTTIGPKTGSYADLFADLMEIQLHGGDVLTLVTTICFLEVCPSTGDLLPQGETMVYDLRINAVQWNEYP